MRAREQPQARQFPRQSSIRQSKPTASSACPAFVWLKFTAAVSVGSTTIYSPGARPRWVGCWGRATPWSSDLSLALTTWLGCASLLATLRRLKSSQARCRTRGSRLRATAIRAARASAPGPAIPSPVAPLCCSGRIAELPTRHLSRSGAPGTEYPAGPSARCDTCVRSRANEAVEQFEKSRRLIGDDAMARTGKSFETHQVRWQCCDDFLRARHRGHRVVLSCHYQRRALDQMEIGKEVHRLSFAAPKFSHKSRIPYCASIALGVVGTPAIERAA